MIMKDRELIAADEDVIVSTTAHGIEKCNRNRKKIKAN